MSRSPSPSLLGSLLTVAALLALHAVAGRSQAEPASSGPFGTPRSTDEPLADQHARAAEPHRGRDARSPWQIPWTGWLDILKRTWQEIDEDRLLAIAAGVVFYALLAVFPAVTALVSFYGLFTSPQDVAGHLAFAADVMPAGTWSIIHDQIARVLAKGEASLSLAFVFSLALAVWSANAGMKAIIDALNVVYDETEKRGFFRLNFVSLCFTIGTIAASLCAIGAVVVIPLVLAFAGFGSTAEDIVRIVRWPILLLGMLLALAILYRYGPSRRMAQWRWISVGAVLATVLWLAGSLALSYYLANFADYNATYGSLGAAIGMMMWLWMSAIVVLLGAELDAEIEHQTAVDSTVGGARPLGVRGAAMADTVGEAQAGRTRP